MQVLYHSSPNKHLTKIHPQKTLSNDVFIGNFVFATSDIKLAAMYLATKGNATLMNVKAKKPIIVICNNPKDYIDNDKGGAIYTVPASTFVKSPQEGLRDSEVVSSVTVIPIDKQVYASSLDAMQKMGITVYFVKDSVFNEIIEAKNEEIIISKLKPFRTE